MDESFVELYKELIKELRDSNFSYPSNMTPEEWKDILDEMLKCLSYMGWDIRDDHYRSIEYKDKFFELFSKHFYDLWD